MNTGALIGLDLDVPLWLIFIVLNILAYYIYMTWHFDTFKKMDIRGPSPLPVFGNLRQMFQSGMREFEIENRKKYGKIYGIFMGRIASLTVADPEILRQVLVKEFPHFNNRQIESLLPGRSLLSSAVSALTDEHWKHVRNSLTPTFSGGKLKLMQNQILKCADQLVEHIRKESQNGQSFDLKRLADAFSMDVIAFTTYGIELDSHTDPNNIFVRMNKKVLSLTLKDPRVIAIFFFPFLRSIIGWLFPIASPEMDNFFLKITHDVLDDRKRSVSKKQKDFIQLMADSLTNSLTKKDLGKSNVHKDAAGLIWTNDGLTEREIAANALVNILAGYENNSATLSFVAHCLATNPDVQEKLIQEIDSKLDGKEPKYEDVAEMGYLQQVIEETQRLYPIAPRLERAVKDDITINGIHFPKGIQVGIPVIALHMDPDIWPEPEKFDPDRFSDEEKVNRDPYYYMPFGMGPRNCIGLRLALLEIKLALIRLLQNFTFVPCDKTEVPLKLKTMKTTPLNGVFLSVKAR